MAPVGVSASFLFLLTTHLVSARIGCSHEQYRVQCPAPSSLLCLVLKSGLQACESDSVCPCGAQCCSLGCGDYCWSMDKSRVPDQEIASNDFTRKMEKRSVLALPAIAPTAMSYLQNPTVMSAGYYPSPIPTAQQPIIVLPPTYPANLPNRFDPYPTFTGKPSPVPPPVAEFQIVGTNQTLKLIRSNAADGRGEPLPHDQYPLTVFGSSVFGSGKLQQRTGSGDISQLDSRGIKTLNADTEGKTSKPTVTVVDESTKKHKRIELLKKALQRLGFNQKIAERLRHKNLIEKLLRQQRSKVKVNFYLDVKDEGSSHVSRDSEPPVIIDGNTYDFIGRKGVRIPYTWVSEKIPHYEKGTDQQHSVDVKSHEKNVIENEYDVFIYYNKGKKETYNEVKTDYKIPSYDAQRVEDRDTEKPITVDTIHQKLEDGEIALAKTMSGKLDRENIDENYGKETLPSIGSFQSSRSEFNDDRPASGEYYEKWRSPGETQDTYEDQRGGFSSQVQSETKIEHPESAGYEWKASRKELDPKDSYPPYDVKGRSKEEVPLAKDVTESQIGSSLTKEVEKDLEKIAVMDPDMKLDDDLTDVKQFESILHDKDFQPTDSTLEESQKKFDVPDDDKGKKSQRSLNFNPRYLKSQQ